MPRCWSSVQTVNLFSSSSFAFGDATKEHVVFEELLSHCKSPQAKSGVTVERLFAQSELDCDDNITGNNRL